MKKIIILGIPGAGKTTFSKKVSKILNIDLYHLDKIIRKSGWISTPKEEVEKKLKEITKTDNRIIDGNNLDSIKFRAPYADTAILFNYNPVICVWRIVKRYITLKIKNSKRDDMSEGCHNKLDLSFLFFVLKFRKNRLPLILRALEKNKLKAIVLKNDKDVKIFLRKFKNENR